MDRGRLDGPVGVGQDANGEGADHRMPDRRASWQRQGSEVPLCTAGAGEPSELVNTTYGLTHKDLL